MAEHGYRAMPQVEQTLASYLSTGAASSLKAPVLPSKPLRVTSALVGKGYTAAGQAGACLHTMSVLQAYQADLLKELDEGEKIKADDISELRRARAIGRSTAALVAAERHLWLTLSDMKEKDRIFLLDAPLAPSGLFRVVSQIRSEDWFVTIDLKDAYFHVSILPHHRKFLRFAFRGEAYQYRVLPFSLALSPRTFTKSVDAALAPLRLQSIHILNYIDDWLILAQSEQVAVRHQDVVLAHMKELGLRLITKKKDYLSRRGVGFDHDAGTFVSCTDRVDPHRSHESERGPVTHCQAVSTPAGADGSCVQCDTFWPAVHEIPTVVAQDQGVLPEGKPAPHDQGHTAMPTCLRHVEKPLVLVPGPGAGSSLSPRNASDRCIPHRLGGGHGWPPCPQSVERSPTHVAHKLPGDAGHVVYYINHQGGLRSCPLYKLAHQILVWSQGKLLSLRAVHLPGYLNMGADSLSRQGLRPGEWMLHPEVVKQIWRFFGQAQVDLFATQENAQCPRWFSLIHPAPLGLDAMVQTRPRLYLYAFPPIALLPGVLERVRRDGVSLLLVAPYWPGRVLFSDLISLLDGSPWEFPVRRLSPLTGRGFYSAPPPRAVEAVGVAPEGAHLIASGISAEVVETILQSRAPSTRKLYALKWRLFTLWCGHRLQDPVNCPVGTVLDFLQDRLSAGLTHSTLKVYVEAIAAYNTPLGGLSIEDLCRPPFEPIEEISDRHLTIKTVLLLALPSLKRVGDIQALSVAPSFLDFAPGLAKDFLYPRSGYLKSPPQNHGRLYSRPSVVLPFGSQTSRSLIVLDSIRPQSCRVEKVGPAFCLLCAYESSGLPPPVGIKAHSTRSMAASKAFLAGVPIQDICNAAALIRQGLGVRQRGHLVPIAFWTQLEFLKGNVSGYVCNPGSQRERDAASWAILPVSLRALASLRS
ncbi:Gag-Pol polyprotein [Labeo rohita]|uniref:ribonuclease H n=1 Tax=Labeo rohita TaxID=84645 RepID=A0ABQ8L4W2_LABRO|nr:Gag-Pol polyprotein [Labeo rohita]